METHGVLPGALPGDRSAASGISWADVVTRYLSALGRANYSPATIRARQAMLTRFGRWQTEGWDAMLATISPGLLEVYQGCLASESSRTGRPLSWGVQALHVGTLKTFLGWCVREGLLTHDPSVGIRLPRQPHRLPRLILSAAQAEMVLTQPDLTAPRGLRDRAILEVLYSTGLRRAELAHLCVQDLDAEQRSCFIRSGKGQRDRVIPIGVRALGWVHRYLTESRPAFGGACETLFLTIRGKPFGPSRLSELVNRYLRLAGFGQGGSCHVFRHTVATLMLDGGADVRHVQAMLGHTDLRTTARYTHVAIAALRAVHGRTHPGERRPE